MKNVIMGKAACKRGCKIILGLIFYKFFDKRNIKIVKMNKLVMLGSVGT